MVGTLCPGSYDGRLRLVLSHGRVGGDDANLAPELGQPVLEGVGRAGDEHHVLRGERVSGAETGKRGM